jgi:hypothetical protein
MVHVQEDKIQFYERRERRNPNHLFILTLTLTDTELSTLHKTRPHPARKAAKYTLTLPHITLTP